MTAPAAATSPATPASAAHADLDYRPSYLPAGIVSLVVFVLYLATLAPSTAMWDTSEYISAAYTLGIPHPPGNPFFVLIGRFFTLLPFPVNIATRINILAAFCSAVTCGAWFLIVERVLVSWLAARWQRWLGGALAALIGATAFTVWNQSVVNEKVYTVSLVFFALACWLTVLWSDDPVGRRADRILVLISYLLGLGYANHPAGFLVAPAVGAAVLAIRWQTVFRWRLLLACFGALVLGLTPFAMQPIRAAHFPALNEGEPTACETRLEFSCTFSKLTYDRLMANINRDQYGKPSLMERQAPFTAQVGMWWLYFKWQWLRDAHDEHGGLQNTLAVLFFALGLMGGYVHWKRDRQSFWFFGPLIFTVTLALVFYMNFKYGYSQAPDLGNDVPREVRDRDYFYLWSYSAWSVWAGLGLVLLWETIAALVGSDQVRVGRETVVLPRRASWLAASPILALAIVPMIGNWTQASRHGQTDTRDFAHDLLESVEPYGILVTVGDNDTFPLWYAQEVEGIRRDVVVANTSLLNTDWYTRQLIRRPVYEYDAAHGPAIYRNQQWTRPAGPPMQLTMAQADAVPIYMELQGPQTFRAGAITATIRPEQLAHQVLERADFFVLQMIKDNVGRRPIYFSATSGNYGQTLGLGNYLLTQGLARKLLPSVPTTSRDTMPIQGEGWVDVLRTKQLWQTVYEAPSSIIRRGDWVDRPSVGIPYLYVSTAAVLGEALQRDGDQADARKVLGTAQQIAHVVRLDANLLPTQPAPPPAPGDSTAGAPVPVRP